MHQIVWSDGTRLNQQYLQQWDRYWSELNLQTSYITNHGQWGFTHLHICEESLKINLLRLKGFTLILPNGQLMQFNEEGFDYRLSQNLGTTNTTVFLQIYSDNSTEGITGYNPKSSPCAFKALYKNIGDQYDSQRIASVQIKQRQFTLSAHKSPQAAYNLAILKTASQKPVAIDSCFIPQLLNIHCSSQLINQCEVISKFIDKLITTPDKIFLTASMSLAHLLHHWNCQLKLQMRMPMTTPSWLYQQLFLLMQLLDPTASDEHDFADGWLCDKLIPMCRKVITQLQSRLPQTHGLQLQPLGNNLHVIIQRGGSTPIGTVAVSCVCGSTSLEHVSALIRLIKISTRERITKLVSNALDGINFAVHRLRPSEDGYNFQLEFSLHYAAHESTPKPSTTQHAYCIYLPQKIHALSIDPKQT